MKIDKIEHLHCDAGWRTFSFLKVTTDDGLIGWSEYTEGDASRGLTSVIHGMAQALIGTDPRPVQAISSLLYIRHQQAANGVNHRAMAAIENALLDIKGKALGVPVTNCSGVRYGRASPSTGRIAALIACAIILTSGRRRPSPTTISPPSAQR